MMELQYNRRLLLMNQDVPFSILNPPPPSSSPSVFGKPLQVPPARPLFSSNVAYAFLIFFTALFFLGLIILYLRRDSSSRHPPPPPSCKGVDPTVAAKSLPAFSYRRDGKQQADCAICLEELREGEKVKMIVYCNHVFHPECIDAWLAAHVTCPICRCNMRVRDENGHGGESRVEEEEQEEGREVGSQSQSQSQSVSE